MARDVYDEAADARAGGRGNYLRSGRYTLLVDKIHERDSRLMPDGRVNPKGGLSIIAEFVVISSAPLGEREVAADGKTVTDRMIEPNPPGSSVSYVMTDKGDQAVMQPINYKSLVLGVLEGRGFTEDKITSAVLRGVTSAKNPLRGHLVACETVRTCTKVAKRLIDAPQWKGVAQTKEQVAAACAKLDSRGKQAAQTEQPKAPPAPLPRDGSPTAMQKAPDNLDIPDEPTKPAKESAAPAEDENFLDML